MNTKAFIRLMVLSVFVLLTVELAVAGGSYEAQVYGITEWTSTCSAGSRSYWDDMGDAWYNEITDPGFIYWFFGTDICLWGHCYDYFTKDRRWVNGYMTADPFTEQDDFSCGEDRTYEDEGDAVMIFTHGGDDGQYWRGKMRYKDCNDDCYLNGRDELRVGDYDFRVSAFIFLP